MPRKPDLQRGYEAAAQAVRTGKLPKEYRGPALRVTLILALVPLILVLTPALWERIVLGKERKRLVKSANDGEGEMEEEEEETLVGASGTGGVTSREGTVEVVR